MGFEHVLCNFCNAEDHTVLFEIFESPDERQPPAWRGSSAIPVVRCNHCGLVFLNPRYDDERLTALYQDPQMFKGTIDPEGNSRSIANERSLRVSRFQHEVSALHRIRKKGRLLDVGCGLGFFLEALGDDYDAMGIEWSHPVTEMLKNSPLRVFEDRFPHNPFGKGEFDIVTLHSVLDHLPDPMGALYAVRDLLRINGLIMLSLVNFNSIASKIYREGFRLLGPNHLYYFTPTLIQRYLTRAGFHVLKIEYPYFGTEFADPVRHTIKIITDFWALHMVRQKKVRISPPFYGSMMRIFALRYS
ncbi:MAG: type 12 methyltransferase [Nitrospirae bacterium]|nr:MAG: type 12 methyltransferase [Nitrospirota bacterium]